MELFAYLDPATGSLFVQVIIGGIFAGAVILRSYFRAVAEKVKVAFSAQKTDEV